MKTQEAAPNGEKTLIKLFDLLEIVIRAKRPLPGKRVAELSGLPVSTAFRLLKFLADRGYLQKTEWGYSAGLGLVRLGMMAAEGNPLLAAARPYLTELSLQTKETVHLAKLQGTQVIYVDKVEGIRPVRMCSLIGNCAPLYCTGVGKAILAFLPEAESEALLKSFPFEEFTEKTLKSVKQLKAELKKIRTTGFAVDNGEHEPGVYCFAVPILDRSGYAIAGLSVSGAEIFLKPQQKEFAALLKQAAAKISEKIFLADPFADR